MQRALACLAKRDHLDVISRFAQLEFKHGSREKGKDLYESILENYPKRTDVWLIYVSMLIKYTLTPDDDRRHDSEDSARHDRHSKVMKDNGIECRDHQANNSASSDKSLEKESGKRGKVTATADAVEGIRNVFERVINMGLSDKKLLPILKKYLDFERRFGSESNAQRIHEKVEQASAVKKA